MISLAFFGPIPWMYCNAITTRLLVGMLTPAMRATVLHSSCRLSRNGRRSLHAMRFANDNATPSPFPGARYRSTSRLGCGLLMDSTAFRQPPLGFAFARRRLRGLGLALWRLCRGPGSLGGLGPGPALGRLGGSRSLGC